MSDLINELIRISVLITFFERQSEKNESFVIYYWSAYKFRIFFPIYSNNTHGNWSPKYKRGCNETRSRVVHVGSRLFMRLSIYLHWTVRKTLQVDRTGSPYPTNRLCVYVPYFTQFGCVCVRALHVGCSLTAFLVNTKGTLISTCQRASKRIVFVCYVNNRNILSWKRFCTSFGSPCCPPAIFKFV